MVFFQFGNKIFWYGQFKSRQCLFGRLGYGLQIWGIDSIKFFSHVHCWQLSGVPVLPATGKCMGARGPEIYGSPFKHSNEIIKAGYHKVQLDNTIFKFVNGEIGQSDAPLQYKPCTGQSIIPAAEMDRVRDQLIKAYGYNPGSWEEVSGKPRNYKILGRIDWNINAKNTMMFRFHATQGKSITNILRDNVRVTFRMKILEHK